MITIAYTIGDQLLTVSPSKRQFAGVMGRVNECKVSFTIPDIYAASPYRVRVEYVDVSGKLFTTDEAGFDDLLTISGSTYSLVLPWQWTAYGGDAHIRIVVYTVYENNVINSLLKSPDCSLHFTNSQEGRDIVERRSLAQLIVDGRGIKVSAEEAIAIATELKARAESGEFDGGQGVPGISPTVQVVDIANGHRVTITDATGAHSFDVMDGSTTGAVVSVNGKTGAVQLSASDIGAMPINYTAPDAPVQSVNGKTGAVQLSASDVGSAPDGYGLGKQAKQTTDLNECLNCGWYAFGSGCLNVPFSYGVAMTMNRYGTGYVQIAFDTALANANHNGAMAKRVYGNGVSAWSEWEFINPPMVQGAEYRTTERINGKAVYKKVDTDGSIVYRLDGDSGWKHQDALVGAVPTSRTVNGKALSSNITLSASDVSAAPSGYGFGGNAKVITNPDDATVGGIYRIYDKTDNMPFSFMILLSMPYYDDWVQIGIRWTSGETVIRHHTASAGWSAWKKIFTENETIPVANGGTGATTADAARTNLGAAPAGYGYGGVAIALGYITSEEELTTALSTVYDSMASWETKLIQFYGYPSASDWRWFGILSKSSANNGSFEGHSSYGSGSKIMKHKYNGNWLPCEWENPPMSANTQYRTTERWKGKPVYTKLIDCGTPATKNIDTGIPYASYDVISFEAFYNTTPMAMSTMTCSRQANADITCTTNSWTSLSTNYQINVKEQADAIGATRSTITAIVKYVLK